MINTAQSTATITEVDRLTIWVLTDNYYDSLVPDSKIAKRFHLSPGKSIQAHHGLSCFVETVVDGKMSYCMFDCGLDPLGVMSNTELLGLDLGMAQAFVLSHGHFDHWMGAVPILKAIQPRIVRGMPFYVGEEAFARRYSLPERTAKARDLGQLRQEDIESLGLKVVQVKEPMPMIRGANSTGKIDTKQCRLGHLSSAEESRNPMIFGVSRRSSST